MQVTLIEATVWKRRLMPLACGCALAGTAAIVALNDPSARGSHFPVCQFHAATGLWCPGCGLTRGFHHLFTGHLMSALGYNIFVPLVLVGVLYAWWNWLRSSWGRSVRQWPSWSHRAVTVALPVALGVYGVLRNIPAAPFRALAP